PRGQLPRVIVIPAEKARLETQAVRLLTSGSRLETELAIRPDGFVETSRLRTGTDPTEAASLVGRMGTGGSITVEWAGGTYDDGFRLTSLISHNKDIDSQQSAELRYSINGDRLLIGLRGKGEKDRVWLEVAPGGSGGGGGGGRGKPPRDGFEIGTPGQPEWFTGRIRFDLVGDEPEGYKKEKGRRYLRLSVAEGLLGSYVKSEDLCLPFGAKGKGQFSQPAGAMLLDARGGVVVGGELRSSFRGLPLEDFQRLGVLLTATTATPQQLAQLRNAAEKV